MPRNELSFEASVERDKDGTWWYVHVPERIRVALKSFETRGHIRVRCAIGSTTWNASLMPWADGSAQLVLKKQVRDSEHLQLRQRILVRVTALRAGSPGS